MKKALAIDIGGTKIFNTIIDESGKILTEVEKSSTPKTAEEIQDTLKNIIKKYEKEVDVIAIATAGDVNLSNNAVIGSTGNLPKGYSEIDFSKLSSKRVFLENDANAAAWAEYKLGASKNTTVSILLTLGTGVGGGIIINDKLLKGRDGSAGEVHFKMFLDKRRKCTCGSWDCFEIYASGKALALDAQEMLNNKDLTSYDVINGVQTGNQEMIKVWERWQKDIASGIVGLTNIFNPDCFVLSGSMADFVDIKKLEADVNADILASSVEIRKAVAGNYSGMVGVALLALQEII